MTQKMTTKTSPLAPNQRITYPVPGTDAVIYLHRDFGDTYRVWVEQGTVVPGWSHEYRDETIARMEATRATKLFHRYGSAEGIETRRAELVAARDEQLSRQRRRMHNAALLVDVETELDALLAFGDMQRLARLRTELTNLYTRAA